MDSFFSSYARLLAEYCLSIKKNDRVFVRSTALAEPLLLEVYREILARGAFYDSRIALNEEERILFESAPDDSLSDISPIEKIVNESYDAILTIRAPYNLKSLQSIPPEKKMKAQESKKSIHDIFSRRSAEGSLRWTLCEFPTAASAQECGMSVSEYSRFIYESCRLNEDDPVAAWKRCSAEQKHYSDFLDKVKTLAFKGDGIDISMSISGRRWSNSDGKRNMPSGEVFSAPVEDSVNGTIRFSYPAIYMGEEIEALTLTVEDGRVVSWSAKMGQSLLDRLFDVPGARTFGEVAVGLNKGVTQFTKNILFDEKMDGTIHMAVGSSYPETGGLNKSAIHLDFITDMKNGGEIIADGAVVYRDGRFLV
jgi:aminopeptidase